MSSSSSSISKDTLLIAGIEVYVYGLSQISQLSQQDSLAVLFLAHPRMSSYKHTEDVAHVWLDHYYQKKASSDNLPHLIAVTFDLRNHGAHMLENRYNMDWANGNKAHAPDMATMIDGSVDDMVTVIEYLPAYIPQFFENIRPGNYINIMSGISLGGHISWRVAATIPDKIYAMAPIIGCPNMSLLFLDRTGKQLSGNTWDVASLQFKQKDNDKYTPIPYDELVSMFDFTEEQKLKYPKVVYDILSKQDQMVVDLPHHIKIFLQCGGADPLVPAIFTEQWCNHRQKLPTESVELYIQPNTGHEFTSEMKSRGADWLVKILA